MLFCTVKDQEGNQWVDLLLSWNAWKWFSKTSKNFFRHSKYSKLDSLVFWSGLVCCWQQTEHQQRIHKLLNTSGIWHLWKDSWTNNINSFQKPFLCFFSWPCSFNWYKFYWDNRLYCTKEHWRFSIEIMTLFMPIRDDLCWTEWVFLPKPAVTAQNQTNGLVFGIVAGFEKESRNVRCEVCADTLIKLFITE